MSIICTCFTTSRKTCKLHKTNTPLFSFFQLTWNWGAKSSAMRRCIADLRLSGRSEDRKILESRNWSLRNVRTHNPATQHRVPKDLNHQKHCCGDRRSPVSQRSELSLLCNKSALYPLRVAHSLIVFIWRKHISEFILTCLRILSPVSFKVSFRVFSLVTSILSFVVHSLTSASVCSRAARVSSTWLLAA
jgi:hypothetical protein